MSSTTTRVAVRPSVERLLEGKVTIVTGASRGIGAATAQVLAEAGAAVVLAARDERGIEAVAGRIIASGGEAYAVATDVADERSVERLIERTLAAAGRIDAAFNNAGDGHLPAPLAEIPVDAFDRTIAVNVRGIFLSMKYEIEAMLATGGGAIVNMSSTAGLRGVKGIASYSAAKHAILGLTKSAALDYAGRNIRVNAVAPGPILTHRLEQLDEEKRRQIGSYMPIGRVGQPEEVGQTVAWLLSDRASFITGATVPVDGGKLAGGA
jgi:NAD(P)-dependent dehydrogenase (short-subunit alcohol dehydrogenase family)